MVVASPVYSRAASTLHANLAVNHVRGLAGGLQRAGGCSVISPRPIIFAFQNGNAKMHACLELVEENSSDTSGPQA